MGLIPVIAWYYGGNDFYHTLHDLHYPDSRDEEIAIHIILTVTQATYMYENVAHNIEDIILYVA